MKKRLERLQVRQRILNYEEKYIREIAFGCNDDNYKINEAIIRIKNSGLNIDKIQFKKMVIDNETFLLNEKIIKPEA